MPCLDGNDTFWCVQVEKLCQLGSSSKSGLPSVLPRCAVANNSLPTPRQRRKQFRVAQVSQLQMEFSVDKSELSRESGFSENVGS